MILSARVSGKENFFVAPLYGLFRLSLPICAFTDLAVRHLKAKAVINPPNLRCSPYVSSHFSLARREPLTLPSNPLRSAASIVQTILFFIAKGEFVAAVSCLAMFNAVCPFVGNCVKFMQISGRSNF